MKRILFAAFVVVVVTLLMPTGASAQACPGSFPGVDTFNNPSLCPVWIPMNRAGDVGELQCLLPANNTISNGTLLLTAKVQSQSCSWSDGGPFNLSYSSGSVMSQNAFLFGTITVTAAMPTGCVGCRPVIWLLGANCLSSNPFTPNNAPNGVAGSTCNWANPGSEEIDIAEFQSSQYGFFDSKLIFGNGNTSHGCSTNITNAQNMHTYQLVWTSASLVFKLDGTTICTVTQDVPQNPMFLWLENTVGGSGGAVTNGTLPASLVVDSASVVPPSGLLPAPTGWVKLSNLTTVKGNGQDLCPPNNFGGSGYNFDNQCAGIFNAWTSFAFDKNGNNGPRMISWSNGGHTDYLGNEIYEFNPRTNRTFRLTNPSTTFPTPGSCSGNQDIGAPSAGHTYGFEQKSPRKERIYIWARIVGNNGCAVFNMWALDTTTVNQACAPTCSAGITQITPTGLPVETSVMSSAAADLNSGLIWVWESANNANQGSFSKFDDVANTWVKTASIGSNATLYGSIAVDTAAQTAMVFSTPNDAPNPGGVFWCNIGTGCTTVNHPALDPSCNAIATNGSAGTYDSLRQEVVFWPGSGATIYIPKVTNPANNASGVTCTSETYGSVAGTSFPEAFNGGTPMFNKFHYDLGDDLYMLCANINTTCWTLKRPPVAFVSNTSGSTLTNTPISISEAFAVGDIPQFPQVILNGSTVTTQADVKQRWSDGSVRFAIVSYIQPSLAANTKQKVYFTNQATGNNTGGLTQAGMLAAGFNFDMQIQQTGTANNTRSARSILSGCGSVVDPGNDPSGSQNGICRFWLQGPIVTAVILDDRSATRSLDFNSDAGTGTPLHPYFEVYFYPQNNNVQGIAAVENVWASSTTSKSMRDQTYAFTLTGGNTSPLTLFTQASFGHIGRSRWVKDYCITGAAAGTANTCNPAVAIDHNAAYQGYSRAIPMFDPDLILPASMVSGMAGNWTGSNRTLVETGTGCDGTGGIGQYCLGMNSGGTSPWFGILNTWETFYWFSDGDPGMTTSVLGNTQVAGRIPFHYREADTSVGGTNIFYDTGNTISTQGRTISVNARPQEGWGHGFNASFNDNCGGSNTRTLNLGSITDGLFGGWGNGAGSGGMDSSHWPEFAYTAWLITGKFYYLEEAQMSGAYQIGWGGGCPGGRRDGAIGILSGPQEGRGTAWATRAALWAWATSVDASPEQTYFADKLANSGVYRQGTYALTNTDSTRTTAYNFGVANATSPAQNTLHMGMNGYYDSSGFVQAPLDTTVGHLKFGWSPWEWGYMISVFAQARDMGLSTYPPVVDYWAKEWLHVALDPAFGAPYMVGTYRVPTQLVSTNTWIQNAADWTGGFTQGNGSGLATSWIDDVHSQKPCNYSPEDDHWHAAPLAILGMMYSSAYDGYTGKQAYDTIRQSLYGTTGCMPAMYNNPAIYSLASPKWDIVSRLGAVSATPQLNPAVSLSPTSVNFGNQNVATTSGSQNGTLTNTGTATLNITTITLTGTNAADFTITSNNCGASLAVSNNCVVGVSFTPSVAGARSASLTFTTNASTSPDNVSLTGTGVATGTPAATFTPSSVSFGLINVGQSSSSVPVTLQNTGTAVMNITSIGLTGTNAGEFQQNNACPGSLSVSGTCTINVTLTPTSRGGKVANVSVVSNTATSPDTAGLSGTGIAPVASLSATTATFFNQLVGTTTSVPIIVVLSNIGDATMSISSIGIGGTNAADFGNSTTCGATLATSSSCNITITFSPSAVGARSASLSITDNAAGSPQVVTLSGTGVKIVSGQGSVVGTGIIKVNP